MVLTILINTQPLEQLDTTTAQENKVTITLIAVVVLFLICQTPAAVQLVYTMNNDTHTNLDIGEFSSTIPKLFLKLQKSLFLYKILDEELNFSSLLKS